MPGWSRRRRGRGFEYRDETGELLTGADRQRCIDLVIPPAWREVWICPLPHGHLQATGLDDLGRRQYVYHPVWRERREREKFDHTLVLARNLPRARRRARKDLALIGVPRARALAVAFMLLDFGLFRIGSPRYEERHGSYGLSTIRAHQLSFTQSGVRFEFAGKSHVEQEVLVDHEPLVRALRALTRGREPEERLLHYRDSHEEGDLNAEQINEYIELLVGPGATAKDFRTWHATVFAACQLALRGGNSYKERQASVREVVNATAQLLGNTPAVARASYIDPRVIDAHLHGEHINMAQKTMPPGPPFPPRAENAVLDFLT